MKAIVQDTYGSAEVLEVRDIDAPVPTDAIRYIEAGRARGKILLAV